MSGRLRYALSGRFASWPAKLRAIYWMLRGWESEICHECGRPVRLVWWCHDDRLWEAVTGNPKPPGRENAAGVWCITCFNEAAREHGGWIEWAPLNLRHLEQPRPKDMGLAEGKRIAFAPSNCPQPPGPPIGGLRPAEPKGER